VSAVMSQLGLFIKDWTAGATQASYEQFIVKPYVATEPAVALDTTAYPVNSVNELSLSPALTGFHPSYTQLYSFTAELSAGLDNDVLAFQIGRDTNGDGVDQWYYHTGTEWSVVTDVSTQYNTASEINAFLPTFVAEIGVGQFYFQALLLSDGASPVNVERATLYYDGPPVGSLIPDQILEEDHTYNQLFDLHDYFNDTNHSLTYSVVNDLDEAVGTLQLDEAGKIHIELAPNVNGDNIDTLQFKAMSLGGNVTLSNIVTIDILPQNDDPVALPDSSTTSADANIIISVLDNDSDIDGDVLTVVNFTQPDQGQIIFTPSEQSFSYLPPLDFVGQTDFTYTVEDSAGIQKMTVVTVIVTRSLTAVDSSQTNPTEATTTIDNSQLTIRNLL
jgi:hypothetical protein